MKMKLVAVYETTHKNPKPVLKIQITKGVWPFRKTSFVKFEAAGYIEQPWKIMKWEVYNSWRYHETGKLLHDVHRAEDAREMEKMINQIIMDWQIKQMEETFEPSELILVDPVPIDVPNLQIKGPFR